MGWEWVTGIYTGIVTGKCFVITDKAMQDDSATIEQPSTYSHRYISNIGYCLVHFFVSTPPHYYYSEPTISPFPSTHHRAKGLPSGRGKKSLISHFHIMGGLVFSHTSNAAPDHFP